LSPAGKSSICFGEQQTLNQYSPRPPSLTIEERGHWWVGAAKGREFELFFFFFLLRPTTLYVKWLVYLVCRDRLLSVIENAGSR